MSATYGGLPIALREDWRHAPTALPLQEKIIPVPDDFPQRLAWFKHASGLSWVEIARRLGVDPVTVRRWWQRGVRPNYRHLKALHDLADSLGLGHLFNE